MRAFIDRELIPLEPIFDRVAGRRVAAGQAPPPRTGEGAGPVGRVPRSRSSAANGFGQLKLALMSEIIGRCMMSMTIFGVQAPDSGNMELLAHGATDAQKERWLWPNLRGEISSAFALTEPFFAGADPTVIGTTAVKDGDEWVIDGHKWFITNASVADIVLVFAETNPEGRPHRHASMFVVPAGTPGHGDRPRHRRRWRTPTSSTGDVGNHAEIVFDDCRVPADHLIGQPGDGFVLAQQRLGRRPHPPRDALARAGAALARHHVRAGRLAYLARQAARPAPDDPGLRRAVAHGDPGGAPPHVPDGVEDGQVRRRGGARRSRHGQGARVEGRARRARPHDPGVRRARLLERPAGRGVVPLDPLRPDRRRPRRAAQVGAGPHAAEELHAGRGLADRAHPQPAARGRGEVGRAAAQRPAWREAAAPTGRTSPRCSASSTTRSATSVRITSRR